MISYLLLIDSQWQLLLHWTAYSTYIYVLVTRTQLNRLNCIRKVTESVSWGWQIKRTECPFNIFTSIKFSTLHSGEIVLILYGRRVFFSFCCCCCCCMRKLKCSRSIIFTWSHFPFENRGNFQNTYTSDCKVASAHFPIGQHINHHKHINLFQSIFIFFYFTFLFFLHGDAHSSPN